MVGPRLAGRGHVASCEDVIRVLPKPLPLASNFAAGASALPCSSRSACIYTSTNMQRGETMALSEFPRMGFDPFAELRRMQSEMNRLFAGYGLAASRESLLQFLACGPAAFPG